MSGNGPRSSAPISSAGRGTSTLPVGLVRRARLILLLDQDQPVGAAAAIAGLVPKNARTWIRRFLEHGPTGLQDQQRTGRPPVFPPEVALHLVKMAGERPDEYGRSLAEWDCQALARQLVADGVGAASASDTVGRILSGHKLKPWRHPLGLSPQVPRDAACAAPVQEVCDLYTRPLAAHAVALCIDEKTSLQPRPRTAPPRAAVPGQPVRVEHEYERKGALNLFAAFATRTGKVYGMPVERKRPVEFIAFLEMLDREIPAPVTAIHGVLDNLRRHKGKQVPAWRAKHPRFVFHHPPVHCTWMNQVEQWFSILQRKRLCSADFAGTAALAERLQAFIRGWNPVAHPFNGSTKSVAKIMAKCESAPPAPTESPAQAA